MLCAGVVHGDLKPINVLVPGNGFGKTTAMAHDFDCMARHDPRWRDVPTWPVRGIWFGKLEDQLDEIREQVRQEVFGPSVVFSDDQLRWPDGSTLSMHPANDTSAWKKWQGINPDWIGFDETPPRSLWREAMFRRRGKRNTRFVMGATQAEGITWAHADLFLPWRDWHKNLGIDEFRAQRDQRHPDIWLWHEGGIDDNPGTTEEQRAFYRRQTERLPPKMAKVRLRGGFESWVGDPFFNEAAIERMRAKLEDGRLVELIPA